MMSKRIHGWTLAKLLMFVVRDAATECWNWQRSLDSKGYGRIYWQRRHTGAHRVSYILHHGPIPDGLTIDHLCRNRRCVNPDHLEPVSRRENMLRGFGVSGINARKTDCPKGHPLDGDNLRSLSTRPGTRICRICNAMSCRKYAEGKRKKRSA